MDYFGVVLGEGIRITKGQRRIIVIEKVQENGVQSVQGELEHANDATHAILANFGGHVVEESPDLT
jgi:hypothetical protein